MTSWQKAIKYIAMAFAIFLIVSIISGIIGAAGVFGGLFENNTVLDDLQSYSVSQEITGLKVDINAADFTVKSGDAFLVESNLENLTVEEKAGTLVIREKSKSIVGQNYNGAVLTLSIPTGFVFSNAEIVTGAGRLTVDSLSCEMLELELGAGEVKIDELNAYSASEINGGAGAISINGGTLNNLDFDMGVGKLNLTAAIIGDSELNFGVGETNLTLVGAKEDYRLDFDKGLGSAVVDGQNMRDGSVYGSGEHKVDIDGGVGAINIRFVED